MSPKQKMCLSFYIATERDSPAILTLYYVLVLKGLGSFSRIQVIRLRCKWFYATKWELRVQLVPTLAAVLRFFKWAVLGCRRNSTFVLFLIVRRVNCCCQLQWRRKTFAAISGVCGNLRNVFKTFLRYESLHIIVLLFRNVKECRWFVYIWVPFDTQGTRCSDFTLRIFRCLMQLR